MRRRVPAAVVLALFVAVSCDQQPVEPATDQVAEDATFKVDRDAYFFDVDLGAEAPYPDCLGEAMQNQGTVRAYVRERVTPSGNLLVSGWVDYDYFGGVTLVGLSSGDVYTLLNGHNPWSEVIKDNGFYSLAYHWNEQYRNDDGQILHILLKGHVKIEPDGTVKIERESYKCN
jgi:hypothetical protein